MKFPIRRLLKVLRALAILMGSLIGLTLVAFFGSVPVSWVERPGDLLSAENDQPLVIDNIHVVDILEGEVVLDRQLVIVDGIIEKINAAGTASESGFRIIDGGGQFVTPGLVDMHVHVHDRKYLGVYLAHGVTAVRNMRGLPMHLRWKMELENKEWLGSTLYTSSPVLDGEKHAHVLQQVVVNPEEGRRLVRLYKKDGYDLIKAYGYLEKEVFEAIVDESRKQDIPVAKHGPNSIEGLGIQSNAGMQSLEHVEDILQGALEFNFEPDFLNRWIAEFQTINPTVAPTLATYNHLRRLSEEKSDFVSTLEMDTLNPLYKWISQENTVRRWLGADQATIDWNNKVYSYLTTIVVKLDRAGITLLVGSDAGTMYMPPGSSTHDEIELMVAAGLSSQTVLKAATLNAAIALGNGDQQGSIQSGKVADLVLVSKNPIKDISVLRHPDAVVKGGQWISRADLDRLLEAGKNPSSFYISVGRLLEDLLSRKFR